MDIVIGIVIFIVGFVLGALLAGSGAAVKLAQTEAEAQQAFRQGWWTGLQDARNSQQQTPPEPPVVSKRKGMN